MLLATGVPQPPRRRHDIERPDVYDLHLHGPELLAWGRGERRVSLFRFIDGREEGDAKDSGTVALPHDVAGGAVLQQHVDAVPVAGDEIPEETVDPQCDRDDQECRQCGGGCADNGAQWPWQPVAPVSGAGRSAQGDGIGRADRRGERGGAARPSSGPLHGDLPDGDDGQHAPGRCERARRREERVHDGEQENGAREHRRARDEHIEGRPRISQPTHATKDSGFREASGLAALTLVFARRARPTSRRTTAPRRPPLALGLPVAAGAC